MCLEGTSLRAEPTTVGSYADQVYARLGAVRDAKQLAAVARSATLDALARRRAAAIAAAPPERRLPPAVPLDELVAEIPALESRQLLEYIDLQRGIDDPAQAIERAWRERAASWETVTDPRTSEVGIASRRAGDGTWVTVMLFALAAPAPGDLDAMAHRVERAINRLRRESGLKALNGRSDLREVARLHSEDMAARGYFAHESPDGDGPGARARRGGVRFRTVAENLAQTPGMDDPVAALVEGWMASKGHRANLLDPRFLFTGVGVAVDGNGMLLVTQLFLTPATR